MLIRLVKPLYFLYTLSQTERGHYFQAFEFNECVLWCYVEVIWSARCCVLRFRVVYDMKSVE